jgi:hypothetical protein
VVFFLHDSPRGFMVTTIEEYAECPELWRAAGDDEILLPGMSRKQALSLRSRLYRIRAAMADQQHQYYPKAAGAKISLIQIDTGAGGEDLWTLAIVPSKLQD